MLPVIDRSKSLPSTLRLSRFYNPLKMTSNQESKFSMTIAIRETNTNTGSKRRNKICKTNCFKSMRKSLMMAMKAMVSKK